MGDITGARSEREQRRAQREQTRQIEEQRKAEQAELREAEDAVNRRRFARRGGRSSLIRTSEVGTRSMNGRATLG